MPNRKSSTSGGRRPREGKVLDVPALSVRRAQRARVGPLRGCLVRPATLEGYRRACRWFFVQMAVWKVAVASEVWEFDEQIGDAIEFAWETGLSRAHVGNLLSGLEHYVNALRGNLRGSWRLWRVWGEQEVPCRAPPLSLRAMMAICFYMWTWGYPEAALMTCVAYTIFLRTMEFVGMTASQVAVHPKLQLVHIQLPLSKGAARSRGVEGVLLEEPLLVRGLALLVQRKSPGDSLIGLNAAQYRVLFDKAVEAVSLSPDFKPYSLRRGGASHHFRRFGNISLTMEIGRWSDLRTAKTYVNTALLEFTSMEKLNSSEVDRAAGAFVPILGSWSEGVQLGGS